MVKAATSLSLEKNPKLPGLMTYGLPAFDETISSEIFAKHLNALHDSRLPYIQTESNIGIRKALSGNVRAAVERRHSQVQLL